MVDATQLRLILIVIGSVIIALILWDGFRRMRKNQLPIKEDKRLYIDEDAYEASLGVSKARVQPHEEPPEAASAPEASSGKQEPSWQPLAADEPAEPEPVEPQLDALPEAQADDSAVIMQTPSEPEPSVEPVQADPDLVLVLNVISRDTPMDGPRLLPLLLNIGMQHGEMGIFHRHQHYNGQGPVWFSLANAFEPGTFDLDAMESFSTQGVSLFLALPGPNEPLKAFDTMLMLARQLAETFGAELRDNRRSVFTSQTAEYYREQLREYTRKHTLAQG